MTCGRLVENHDAERHLVRTGRQPDKLVGRTQAGDVQGSSAWMERKRWRLGQLPSGRGSLQG